MAAASKVASAAAKRVKKGWKEIGSAESLGGDDQVQWWHLRGERNLRVLSSELREAMFLLRTPQRPLGVEPNRVRIDKRHAGNNWSNSPRFRSARKNSARSAATRSS